MITSRSPLRVSLAGGGSDFNDFYSKFGGSVVSFAIEKYVYVNLNRKFLKGLRFAYSITENVSHVKDIIHPLFRETLLKYGIEDQIEVTTMADVPSKGTGLASSSAFTAALIKAISQFKNIPISKHELAELVCEIEIDKAKSPIGKQDQFATAFGGINNIIFHKNGKVEVCKISLQKDALDKFEKSLVLLHTGIDRDANKILETKNLCKEDIENEILKQKALTNELVPNLLNLDLKRIGEIITESWNIKKKIYKSSTNQFIDQYINEAIKMGAFGGKLLGAGDGGFILLICSGNVKNKIINGLGLKKLNAKIDFDGTKILYNDGRLDEDRVE